MAAGVTAGAGLGKVRYVGVHRQNHVAGMEDDDGIGVSGGVVQEEEDFFIVISVGEACSEARDPSAASMVRSTARA